jgi:hypothetical protein
MRDDVREVSWQAPEFHYYEKGPWWYWLVGIVGGAVAALALLTKNPLFGIFTVVATVLVITWGRREPRTVAVSVSSRGVAINEKTYPYDRLRGFAVSEDAESSALAYVVLRTKDHLNGWVKIMVGEEQVAQVRAVLSSFLPEVAYEESLAEHLARLIRF